MNSNVNITIHLGRELTKMHEEMIVGTPAEILETLTTEPVRQKGEFVVIMSGDKKAVQESPLGEEEIWT